MTPRIYVFRFTNQTRVSIPGALHQLGTSNLFIEVFDAIDGRQSWTSFSTIDPITYDVKVSFEDLIPIRSQTRRARWQRQYRRLVQLLSFDRLTVGPFTGEWTETHLPPQSGTILLRVLRPVSRSF